MQDGRRIAPSPSLDEIRRHAKRELERLPEDLRRLEPGAVYPVEVADDLVELAAEVDRRMQGRRRRRASGEPARQRPRNWTADRRFDSADGSDGSGTGYPR